MKPFATVIDTAFEKYVDPVWSVKIPGCGLGLDFREKKIAERLADQINAAHEKVVREARLDAIDEAADIAAGLFQSGTPGVQLIGEGVSEKIKTLKYKK